MPRSQSSQQRWWYLSLGIILAIALTILCKSGSLWQARQTPTEAYLVLGGSIRREMHMAQLASTFPQPQPILISTGSVDPCIRLLFEQASADLDQVWLEHCAQSTFGNFVYAVPLLERWQVHHVTVVTSGNHTRRALILARILFGAQGIWVEPLIVDEIGIPGNQETVLKTILDIGRSLLWAVVAQVHKPTCHQIVPLTSVNLEQWQQQGFKCEHQSGIKSN